MNNKEKAFNKFWTMIENDNVRIDCLPNTSKDYTKEQESFDVERYKRLINSSAFDDFFGWEELKNDK